MASNPNALFYKTAPYLYAKHFNLTSVLDGLTGYKIVSGETEAISDENAGGVFGEIQPREKPKLSENKYFTRQIIKKPAKYNPYARTTERTKAYRPDNYAPFYGQEKEEQQDSPEEGSNDFFGLNPSLKSVQMNSAFPGYQPYTEESDTNPTKLHNHNITTGDDDDLPSPSLDAIQQGKVSLVSYDDEEQDSGNGDTEDVDFYKQLENLAQGGSKHGQSYAPAVDKPHKVTKKHPNDEGQERLRLPETEQERWNYSSHKYQTRTTSMGTYKCWKCKRVGHLPEDCTAFLGVAAPSPDNPNQLNTPLPPHMAAGAGRGADTIYSPDLKVLYQKCKEISARKGDKCGVCGARANLSQCLDCGVVVCDNKSHLIRHLRDNPSHNMLYSYKLRRQIKCCKSTCNVTNVYELHACAQCLEKCFDRHYSMMNAAWSGKGIKYIPNAICCDDHFEWHRINCSNSRPGFSSMVVEKPMLDGPSLDGQLSEVLF